MKNKAQRAVDDHGAENLQDCDGSVAGVAGMR